MFGSIVPSLRSLSNHSLLGSRSRHCYAIMWISNHEKDNPPESGRVIQKMSDNRRKQTVTPQEIRYAPHHPEKRSGQNDAEPDQNALIQITSVREAEGKAGN